MNRSLATAGSALIAALVLASSAHAQKPPARGAVEVKLGTLAPRGSSFHQILMQLAQQWRGAPSGGVELRTYTDGTQGTESDMVGRMRVGQLHAGLLTGAGLVEIDPSVGALQNMPLVFRSLAEVDLVREALRGEIERRLLDKGFVVLFWGDAGWIRFFSKDPIVHPAEMKRAKLFVTTGDNRQLDIMKSSGFQPVALTTADILPSLQTGMIDAVPVIPTIALAGQFYTKTPNMLELDWCPLVGALVVTRAKWESLPPAVRAELLTTSHAAGERMKERMRAESDQAVETMKKHGLKVQSVSAEAAAEWRATLEPIYGKIRGGVVPAELFDRVQKLLADARAHPAAGPR